MVRHILIPTDGSEFVGTAIAYGIHLAGKLDIRLTGLHVIDVRLLQGPAFTDLSGSIGLPPYQEYLPAMESSLEAKADAILRQFRDQCEAAGIHPETKKVTGVIEETIIEVGKRYCDWILLAQRGEHFHIDGGAILGTTAQAVVRHSGKPVLVTPEHFREIKNMALAFDGSAPARNALTLAGELSSQAAWPLSVVIITDDPVLGERRAEEARGLLKPVLPDPAILVLKGKEDKELVRLAKGEEIDLLVMGAYGQNRLREMLLGSTTSAVIRKSSIPVLLTR